MVKKLTKITNSIFWKQIPQRILIQFIQDPIKKFSARALARALKISHATVLKYLQDFQKQDLIFKYNKTLYPTYHANSSNQYYILYKKTYIKEQIIRSDLITFIADKIYPFSIILFGSCAKGSFNNNSDIDIFVEANHQELDLKKFERILGRKINLLFEKNIYSLSKELWVNVVNGQVLYGYLTPKSRK
jgi:predicted nucleotidyltransferase